MKGGSRVRAVFENLKKYKLECVIAPLFKLLEACFDLTVPIVVTSIIDVGINGGAGTEYILTRCLILVCLGIVGLVCAITAQYFAARAATGAASSIRRALFSHLQKFSYTETDTLGVSSMITRMTGDINQVQSGVNMSLRLFLRSPIIVFGAMIMAFSINVKTALIFTVVIPILSVIVFGIILTGIPIYRKVQSRLDKVTSVTRENLAGVRVIRAFGKEDEQVEEFSRANESHSKIQKFAGNVSALMNPLTYVVVNLGIIAIVYLGAPQVDNGVMTQGELVAVYNYMTQILVELVKLANTIFLVTKAVACARRVQNVLDTDVEIPVIPDGENRSDGDDGEDTSAVSFSDVSLTYKNGSAPVLSRIDFSAKKGMTVGIIGGTGSGKSSLINLIPRFYDATEGEVRVFGKNVNSYQPDLLRQKIGIVPQKAVLFKGTVRSNLAWGNKNTTDEEMWQALRIAQADSFVLEKEGGLSAEVKQGGRNFSGGQRQRLTIARALVGKPQILIFDDSTSALDFATESRLRKALTELDYDPTVFIISQRTSSISHADLIVVLEDGEAVGIGEHSELLASCPVYKEIYDSQFRGGDGN